MPINATASFLEDIVVRGDWLFITASTSSLRLRGAGAGWRGWYYSEEEEDVRVWSGRKMTTVQPILAVRSALTSL